MKLGVCHDPDHRIDRGGEEAMRVAAEVRDIVGPQSDFSSRALVWVPALLAADNALAASLANSDAQVPIGPRSGSKSTNFRTADSLAPGPLAAAAGLRVRAVESLRPGVVKAVQGEGLAGRASRSRKQVEPAADFGLAVTPLAVSLRLRRCGALLFAFHSGPGMARLPAPAGARFLLGGPEIEATGVDAWLGDEAPPHTRQSKPWRP